MSQQLLQIAIAFFAVQVAGWIGLCVYIQLKHRHRADSPVATPAVAEPETAVAQAA